ncbi:hypothetical protein BP6252_10743 [Coleophoma cylindrospora]|uniref:Alpha-L-rhamnosidase six-hairpin glycosidase domain-containing protein n=1 Tax=Coleophoma cylindrospora TaxID=1849047 RepID=A0A3D8QTJ3_9HELO|nr:hypothetical protein BP6252_10743 [Coleophoma cylindrospora]
MVQSYPREGVTAAFPGPWDRYNFSPASRTQYPVRVYRTTGLVENPANALDFQSTIIKSLPQTNGWSSQTPDYSSVTYDFGKEACGPISVKSASRSTKNQTLGLSYSESSEWVGFDSDESASLRSCVSDGHHEFTMGPDETYTVPLEKQRGAFRYVTIFTKDENAILELTEMSAEFTSMPHWADLRAYPAYFYCSDDLLNRIWYAGAYTNQLSTLAKDQGRRCELDSGWLNNAICCTSGETIITDAPRRDRTVWAGDLAIVVWSQFATINDSMSMRNALDTLFGVQSADGHFPWAGPPICHDSVSDVAKLDAWPYISDSYHLWTILVSRHFYHITGDIEWLKGRWDAIVLGLELAITKFKSEEGLYYCAQPLDWGRTSVEGYNLSCNILFHETLIQLSSLAQTLDQADRATRWKSFASSLKPNLEKFWDESAGLYFDNLSSTSAGRTLYPQDGNSLACWFGIADPTRSRLITSNLKKRWGPYGPVNPECSGPVSPFISGFELQALVKADKMHDALAMIRTAWGWMLNNPASTGSTMLEAWYADGSIRYPFYQDKPSYISHCHPFSTGPLLVLTFDVLGINFSDGDMAGGKNWEFRPTPGDLETCQGGLTGKYGLYSAGWEKTRVNGRITFQCWVEAPSGTTGRIRIPFYDSLDTPVNGKCTVIMDGTVLKCDVGAGFAWVNNIEGGERHHFRL